MKIAMPFRPRLLDTLRAYSSQDFTADLTAGLTVGRENVCPHIEGALARARAILGLPPAPPTDPLQSEKPKLEAARQELTSALERASQVLNSPPNPGAGDNAQLQPLGKTDSLS